MTNRTRAWRVLSVLLVALAVAYGVMAALGSWTPRLGLDLRGGSSITLTARTVGGKGAVTPEKLNEAVQIISNRVNGTGVAEAQVTTEGRDHIVVQVPGVGSDEIVKLVGQTAQLRFRQVLALGAPAGRGQPAPAPTTTESPTPSGSPTPSASPRGTASSSASPEATSSGSPTGAAGGSRDRGRAAGGVLAATATPTAQPSGGGRSGTPAPSGAAKGPTVSQQPATQEQQAALAKFHCSDYKRSADRPDKPLLACDRAGTTAYVLGPALMLGTDVSGASAAIPQNSLNWQVQLNLTGDGKRKFADATQAMFQLPQPINQFAIVLDGRVVSAPRVDEPIPNGVASIYGDFTQSEASNLANVLKYGALPLAFETSEVSTVSATLGSDSLRGGLLAGIIGLALVVAYSLFYYRALGLVVIGSLATAAASTYAAVVLLGEGKGLTLTLAGIAGLIVAIGITADSFVVYFERLRDEIREGKSLRTAVDAGWARARRTILAADSVSLLAAVVLYALSVGSVRGFAYALGLTTLIDLVVVVMFTHPLVALLSSTRFFGEGHRFSGLDPARLGVPRTRFAPARAARRPATRGV